MPSYPQAKVKKKEDIEGHIDLQREIFVEVLAGFYRTGGQRQGEKHREKYIIIRSNTQHIPLLVAMSFLNTFNLVF